MRLGFASTAFGFVVAATAALAALPVGAPAPDFSATAALGGNEIHFSLSEALKKGPVVLYFYPAAFTPGCTIEAHEFAEATAKFAALHATVIGVSRDGIDKLKAFSLSECRSKFAVAADPDGHITAAYQAAMSGNPALADRISYVIAPDGRVIFSFASFNPYAHVSRTLEAVEHWRASH